ncbi:SRPBCC family protein [Streptomyces sp. NPDC005483]|uniref:SRPBCC family protein n=1 Tax=Streptomyces sp. NPDC005483 TaxID=3154882 RepID=UPI0033B4C277
MPGASESHPDIHWPSGFSPDQAQNFCTAQAVVNAPPGRAFELLSDVARWPEWVPGITEVRAGPLARNFEVWLHRHRFEIFVGGMCRRTGSAGRVSVPVCRCTRPGC